MPDARRQYRVPGPDLRQLSVELGTAPENRVPARVLNLSIGGMRVSVERDIRPEHRLGETVYVRIGATCLDSPLTVPCFVCHRGDLERTCEYSLRFVDWLGLLSSLPPELVSLFNRRGDRRFEPSPSQPLLVEVRSSAEPEIVIEAILRDLSPLGMSFRAPPAAESILSQTSDVHVTFSLPDVQEKFEVRGSIRHRNLVGEDISYGVFFDAERNEDFEDMQILIEEFIAERRAHALENLSP